MSKKAGTTNLNVDDSYLQSLYGYRLRRASLLFSTSYFEAAGELGIRPVGFSVLSLIYHNPKITARAICKTLALQAPNLVKLIAEFDSRGLVERKPLPEDARAFGLTLTARGKAILKAVESHVHDHQDTVLQPLSLKEQTQLHALLGKLLST
ncbi:MAG: hypothetical protein RLZZ502_738 [Pseudomonadota bacterium]|jgi:DNA-binding MarR family transcriptional regulator